MWESIEFRRKTLGRSEPKRPYPFGIHVLSPNEQPSRALLEGHCLVFCFAAFPPLCLPSLHGRYPASSLLRRLCHLPASALRAFGHELRSCCRIVIPDSLHSNFLPFCLQPPDAFPPPRLLAHRRADWRSRPALHRQASASWLRHTSAGSPMHLAESSSSFLFFTDWQFASGCSPPRLSTTQLPPAFGQPVRCPEGTFTSLLACAFRRTPMRVCRC